jgi:hypothetical protein
MGQPEENLTVAEDFTPVDHLAPEERDPEASADDVLEQATLADPHEEEAEPHRGLEVDDWDAIEQARVVGPDDDYR